MNEAQVLAFINQWIISNGNNEITGPVLNAVLVAMLTQPNDKVGELGDLETTDQSSIVAAINELVDSSSTGFAIHAGAADPNVTPPGTFSIGDWYIRSGTSLYQYNGSTWILLSGVQQGRTLSEAFTYTAPNNTFTVASNIFALIDVQIEQGSNYNDYAAVLNGNEVTIDPAVLYGGERIRIIYTT